MTTLDIFMKFLHDLFWLFSLFNHHLFLLLNSKMSKRATSYHNMYSCVFSWFVMIFHDLLWLKWRDRFPSLSEEIKHLFMKTQISIKYYCFFFITYNFLRFSGLHELNPGDLLYYGGVEWLNISNFLGKIKKGLELHAMCFIFRTAVVFLCKERLRSKRKQLLVSHKSKFQNFAS